MKISLTLAVLFGMTDISPELQARCVALVFRMMEEPAYPANAMEWQREGSEIIRAETARLKARQLEREGK